MKWTAALVDQMVSPSDMLMAVGGTSSPLPQVIYRLAGELYRNEVQIGVPAAIEILADHAAQACNDSRVRDAAQNALDPPGL